MRPALAPSRALRPWRPPRSSSGARAGSRVSRSPARPSAKVGQWRPHARARCPTVCRSIDVRSRPPRATRGSPPASLHAPTSGWASAAVALTSGWTRRAQSRRQRQVGLDERVPPVDGRRDERAARPQPRRQVRQRGRRVGEVLEREASTARRRTMPRRERRRPDRTGPRSRTRRGGGAAAPARGCRRRPGERSGRGSGRSDATSGRSRRRARRRAPGDAVSAPVDCAPVRRLARPTLGDRLVERDPDSAWTVGSMPKRPAVDAAPLPGGGGRGFGDALRTRASARRRSRPCSRRRRR